MVLVGRAESLVSAGFARVSAAARRWLGAAGLGWPRRGWLSCAPRDLHPPPGMNGLSRAYSPHENGTGSGV